ncbi:hypothetical protein Tco_0468551 [Tanacetum coccineum]
MTKPEPEKKTKKQLEQERLGHEEAIRLKEQLNEEETQRIARDAEIARQLHEEINKARQERVVAKDAQARKIDLSDPAVLRYHAQLNRPYSTAEVRKNMVIANKSSKNYKIFSEMLDDMTDKINRTYTVISRRYATSRPEGYDLMLWGDLKILFQPDEEDEVWRHQHEYNLISWRLFDSNLQREAIDKAWVKLNKSPTWLDCSSGKVKGRTFGTSSLLDPNFLVIEDIKIQEKINDDTKVVLEEEEQLELVEDQGSGEKGEKEVSTVGAEHSTVIPEVNTVAANLVYIRRSAQKGKDKGKAIMQESEPPKKVKKRVQVQMSMDEQLDKKVFEEEQAKAMAEQEQERINFEEALELQKQYHAQLNRPYSIAEVRKNMVMYLKNQGGYKMNYFKGMNEKKGSRKKSLARKRAGEKQSEESTKRQKIEDDTKKEELKAYLDLVPKEEFAMEIESLATKYPIVDWKTHVLTENFMLVKARYMTSSLEGYDLMLWGDLKTLFEPDEEDEVWRNQQGYNSIS